MIAAKSAGLAVLLLMSSAVFAQQATSTEPVLSSSKGSGQAYPTRPIRMVVAVAAGGNINPKGVSMFAKYKGGAAALPDFLGGRIQVLNPTPSTSLAYIRDGKMRPLLITSPARSPLLPDVPGDARRGLSQLPRPRVRPAPRAEGQAPAPGSTDPLARSTHTLRGYRP